MAHEVRVGFRCRARIESGPLSEKSVYDQGWGMTVAAKKIMVVDETSILVSVMSMVLAGPMQGSPSVDLARSTAAALNLLKQKAYDLLLVNYQTDSLDSMDVLRQLRDADCGAEAVVVAGWFTPQMVESGRRLGVTRFFQLPSQMDDLTNHVRFA